VLTPEELARLRTLCEQATPGPWKQSNIDHPDACAMEYCVVIGDTIARVGCGGNSWNDSAFITAAREAVPALLDENAQLREKITRLEDERAQLHEDEMRRRMDDPRYARYVKGK
jgi:hypothetical protein